MKIAMRLDYLMFKKKVKARDLAAAVGLTEANISVLKTGKAKGVRFSTLAAICKYLECEPGELFELVIDEQ